MPVADNGQSTTITFATSAFVALVKSIDADGEKRKVLPTTHLASTTETCIPGDLVDAGEAEMEILMDPDDVVSRPATAGAPEVITIGFPLKTGDSVNAKVACSGFVIGWKFGAKVEELLSATVKIQFTGAKTWTNASVLAMIALFSQLFC